MGYVTLSEAIRGVRGHRTREEFAWRVGCSFFTLRKWELGETKPSSNAHIRLLVAEGVPQKLFGPVRGPRLPQKVAR